MTVSSEVVPLARREQGDGPLAVLVHGITENSHSFDPLIPLLAPHYRLVSVDLRGHGESPFADSYELDEMAADVAAVVDGLDAGAPLLIGHSLGGAVAAAYAAAHPVRGVVNIDQSLNLAGFQGQLQPIEALLRGPEFEAVMRGLFAQMYVALSDEEKARLEALRRPDQQVVLGVWDAVLTEPFDRLAARMDAMITPPQAYPYLAVHGLPAGPDYVEWLRQRVPDAIVEDWGLLGHYPHLVDPDRFVARVREFDAAIAS